MSDKNTRQFIKAKRSSDVGSRLLKYKDPSPDNSRNDSRGHKRKSSDFNEHAREKKSRNSDQCGPKSPPYQSPMTRSPQKGNSANARLQNLRRSLTENQKSPNFLPKIESKIPKKVEKSNLGFKNSLNIEQTSSKSNLGPQNRNFRNRMSNLNSVDQNTPKTRRSIQDRLKIRRDSLPKTFVKHDSCSETANIFTSSSFDKNALNKSCPAALESSTELISDSFSKSKVENQEKIVLDKSCATDDIEMMDWIPSEENIIENVTEVRKELSQKEFKPDVTFVKENQNSDSNLYIVVDTNIFLAHLEFLKRLKNTKLKDGKSVVIYVPWMVLQELDYMKIGQGQSHLYSSSKKAIDFINSCLCQNDSSLKGQNVTEMSKSNLDTNNPDDGILFACIQLKSQNKNVVLLSNDKNLRNKAIFSDIPSYGQDRIFSDFLEKLNKKSTKNIHCLINPMKNLLNEIIKSEMNASYGENLWVKIVKNKIGYPPPYNFGDCLKVFEKFWKSVFALKLLKQAKLCLEEFTNFLQENHLSSGEATVSDEIFTKFIEFSLRLCIYLKNGFQEKRGLVYDTINLIQQQTKDPTSDN